MARKRMIQAINEAIALEMARDPRVILFGQDVEASVVGDTKGLHARFGSRRVRNTPISEQIMTGAAVGAAAAGYRVICHMMFGNFFYTGFDAIANQATKMRYMTNGQVKLPIVFMAVIGGGRSAAAQHSDSMHPLFMNLGGIKIAMPGSPADGKGLLAAAIRDDNPVVFLQAAGRGGESGEVQDGEYVLPLGVADVKRSGTDATLVAIGSMVRPALRAAATLEAEGVSVEVVDPRTLVPLDEEAIVASVRKTGRLVVADEARQYCSAASEISALVSERCFASLKAPVARVTVPNVAIPYSPPLEKELIPDEGRIAHAIRGTLKDAARR